MDVDTHPNLETSASEIMGKKSAIFLADTGWNSLLLEQLGRERCKGTTVGLQSM